MEINDKLYVEIVPHADSASPRPHPVSDGRFDTSLVYKVLGMYNPSETSECYFVLANPKREIWFISQRHLRAYALIDSDKMFLAKPGTGTARPDAEDGSGNGETVARRPALFGKLSAVGVLTQQHAQAD